MSKVARRLLTEVERKLEIARTTFARELVSDDNHPLRTGMTRANWRPSVNSKETRAYDPDFFGISWAQIEAFQTGEDPLIPLEAAEDVALALGDWDLGDTLIWTNSVDWIIDLEQRRMFFDRIVENARQAAQEAVRRSK